MPGLSYKFIDNTLFKLNIGYHLNEKMKIKLSGVAYSAELKINSLRINEQLSIKSNSKFRRSDFTNKRYFQQIISQNLIENIFDLNNNISLNVNYNSINQDYINFIDQEQLNYLFENNYVRNFDSKIEIKYSPARILKFSGNMLFDNNSRKREYNDFNSLITNSYYKRNSDANKMLFNLNSLLELKNITAIINADFESTKEEFKAESITDKLLQSDINEYINIQRFNDYSSSKFRMNIAGIYRMRYRDSLFINLTASIFRYDTPYIENNDDYDESFSALYSSYKYNFNKNYNLKLIFEFKNRHIVFLKAEKSAQSNSLKTIRFASEMEFNHSKVFQSNPKVDIIANYNVYDFNFNEVNPNTFSYRQVSYLDSAIFWINNNNYLNVDILLRYSERGFLNWNEFSELPFKSNFEQLYKIMFYNKINQYTFGIGVGFYNFDLSDLLNQKTEQKSYVVSPEAYISYKISENSFIIFNGKYDFLNINNAKRESVNANLLCQIYL